MIIPMTTAEDSFEEAARAADRRHLPIIRAYESGMTMQEIADDVGVTKGRVSQIIIRARKRGLFDEDARAEALQASDEAVALARRRRALQKSQAS
jgi:predicted transcriptional regulator